MHEAIKAAKATAWQHVGESGRRVVDYIVSLTRSLQEANRN
jgi:hypothetical protein